MSAHAHNQVYQPVCERLPMLAMQSNGINGQQLSNTLRMEARGGACIAEWRAVGSSAEPSGSLPTSYAAAKHEWMEHAMIAEK